MLFCCLVLSFLIVFLFACLGDFICHFMFQYTVMSTRIPAKSRTPVRGDGLSACVQCAGVLLVLLGVVMMLGLSDTWQPLHAVTQRRQLPHTNAQLPADEVTKHEAHEAGAGGGYELFLSSFGGVLIAFGLVCFMRARLLANMCHSSNWLNGLYQGPCVYGQMGLSNLT